MFDLLKHIGKELKTWRSFIFSMWGILSVVYCFMLCHFWWCAEDWHFQKEGVRLSSGFFEVRYSQHLFNVLLLDGNILPVFTLWLSLLFMVILGILTSYYFKLNQNRYAVSSIVLFVGLNPYLFSFIYYSHYILAISIWSVLVVGLLILDTRMSLKKTVLFGGIGYALLLGGYPPILALSLTLFCGRQIYDFLYENNTWKRSIYRSVGLVVQILIGAVIHKIISWYLVKNDLVNSKMYNLVISSFFEIFKRAFYSIFDGITQFGHQYLYLETAYCYLLIMGLLLAISVIFYKDRRKEIIFWFIGLIVASRFIFIIAEAASRVQFRLEYFGRLGIYILALVLLLKQKQMWMKNVTFIWILSVLSFFLYTDFFIQKNWFFSFDKGRQYQARVLDRIEENENYNPNHKYDVYATQIADYRDKYYKNHISKISPTSEMSRILTLDFIRFNSLYWDVGYEPINRFYYNGNNVYTKDSGHEFLKFITDQNFEILLDMKNKYCPNMKSYPSSNFICIKDNNLWIDLSGK